MEQAILAALALHDGRCLDTEEERAAVAKAVASAVKRSSSKRSFNYKHAPSSCCRSIACGGSYALITHYAPEWNASGFGSKTPGGGRPGMPDRVSKWYQQFPQKPKVETDDSDD